MATIYGSSGDDTLRSGGIFGLLTILGGSEADPESDTGNDFLQGAGNNDVIRAYGGDDTLRGGAGRDTLYGGTGNDRLESGGGAGFLLGEEGNDTIFGSKSSKIGDLLFGGDGDDLIYTDSGPRPFWGKDNASGGGGNDTLSGGGRGQLLNGGDGDDLIIGDDGTSANNGVSSGRDALLGGNGNDTISGGGAEDTLAGGDGADWLDGGGNRDLLEGGADNDTILGVGGSDTITGGIGADLLSGGRSNDFFVYRSALEGGDTITDYEIMLDTVWLSASGFGAGLVVGNLAANLFEANNTGVAQAAETRLVYDEASGELFFDADGSGSGAAILLATILDVPKLTAAQFVVIA